MPNMVHEQQYVVLFAQLEMKHGSWRALDLDGTKEMVSNHFASTHAWQGACKDTNGCMYEYAHLHLVSDVREAIDNRHVFPCLIAPCLLFNLCTRHTETPTVIRLIWEHAYVLPRPSTGIITHRAYVSASNTDSYLQRQRPAALISSPCENGAASLLKRLSAGCRDFSRCLSYLFRC